MKINELAATRRSISPDKMAPEEALELLRALRDAHATPAAVAFDHLMFCGDPEDGAQTSRH